jgi:hypothetical protein
MRITELTLAGRENGLLLQYPPSAGIVYLTVLTGNNPAEQQPLVRLELPDEDAAWIAAETAQLVCDGFRGTRGDVQVYYPHFLRAVE